MERGLPWAGLLARLVVGGVWLVAGVLKVLDPAESIRAVQGYDLLPASAADWVGVALPAIELVVGLALLVGVAVRGAAVISVVLLAAYVAAIGSAWARGLEIDCGCFGGGGADPDAASAYPWEIARDVVLLLASAFVAWLPRTPLALDRVLFPPRTTPTEGA